MSRLGREWALACGLCAGLVLAVAVLMPEPVIQAGVVLPNAMQGNGSGNNTTVTVCDGWVVVNIATSAQLLSGVAGKQIYLCSLQIGPLSGANNVALVEGTGTLCATGLAGMAGGTTPATGWNFLANSGSNLGTGVGVIARTATTGDNICLLLASATQVSGVIGWTQY